MSPRAVRRLRGLLVVLAVGLGVGGCGERQEDLSARPPVERLSLLLDARPNADHAGLYAARASGALGRASVELDVRAPGSEPDVLRRVADGDVDVAISHQPEVLLARERGLDVVAFATVVQRPLTALITFPGSRIAGPRDLGGRTVATNGLAFQSAFLDAIARRAGVDPRTVRRIDGGADPVGAVLARRADAAFGATWNREGVVLQRGPRDPRVLRTEQLGVPAYDELVLVARSDTLDRRESGLRRTVAALAAGHVAAREDPDAAAAVLTRAGARGDRATLAATVRATVPTFFPADRTRPWGWIDYERWAALGEWMLRNRLLSRRQPVDLAATRDFLPGEGTGSGRKTPEGRGDGPNRRPEGYRGA